MNKRKIPETGEDNFRNFILSNNYFVDKTSFIRDFITSISNVLLMPRPKRFGKSLTLSMLEYFFDITKADTKDIFSDLAILKDTEFCNEHQNKYPVINMSLKDAQGLSWEDFCELIAYEVAILYKQHAYLLDSECLRDFEKEEIQLIMQAKQPTNKVKYNLHQLSEFLYRHFGKEVIILVDEYDAPILGAFNNTDPPIKSVKKSEATYYEKVIDFMQIFLGKAFKTNQHLHKGLLTGVLRVSKESLFSKWNNISVFDITSTYFSDSFGFTTDEIHKVLSYFDLDDKFDKIKQWYDGYKFGDAENIYNPWSIMNYVGKPNDGFKAYWINSNDYSLIKSKISSPEVKHDIEKLIKGETIEKDVYKNFVFQDFESNIDLFWTMLTYTGYLTIEKRGEEDDCQLRIPNNEIKKVFTQVVVSWFNDELNINKSKLRYLAKHLINNNIKDFEKVLKQIIGDTLSYHDLAVKNGKTKSSKKIGNEQIYHVYMLGLLSILSTHYIVKSNRESGDGRYDIVLIPYEKERNGIVMEIKSIAKQGEKEKDSDFRKRINTKLEAALNQIDKNKYYKELIDNQVPENKIIKMPIVFAGKEPFINTL